MGINIGTFVEVLNLQWPEFFSIALDEIALSEKQLKRFTMYSLYYLSDDVLERMNIENCLTTFISEDAGYLDIENPLIQQLISGFKLLNVSFTEINIESSNASLLNAVYENSLYKLTIENITHFLNVYYEKFEISDIKQKNYTLIMSRLESPLSRYININIHTYMDIILSVCDGSIYDDAKMAVFILNNEMISKGQKISYISFLRTTIITISDIDDKVLWESLIKNRLIAYTEGNIFEYYALSKKLDKTIIDYINSSQNKLDFSSMFDVYGRDKVEDIYDTVIGCNELSDERYSEIMKTIEFCYDSFAISDLSVEKLRILIDQKAIQMNTENLIFIRSNYKNEFLYFIAENIYEYVDSAINSQSFDFEEMIAVLDWEIDDDIKIKLLHYTSKAIRINGKDYSKNIINYILNNNFCIEELSVIVNSFSSWNSDIQQTIINIAIKFADVLIEEATSVPVDILDIILISNELSHEKKVGLLTLNLSNMDEQICQKYLAALGLTEHLKLFGKGRPKIEVTNNNKILLNAFKQKKWIIDFWESVERVGYYKIVQCKHMKEPGEANRSISA